MKIYVLIADSCDDCNSFGIKIKSTPITDVDKESLIKESGGMFCIYTTSLEMEIDGGSLILEKR